jgi:hypothetical protein
MTEFREGRPGLDTHWVSADADGREGIEQRASPSVRLSPLADIIEPIRQLATKRRFYIDQQRRIDSATGAYVRRHLGWSWEMPERERRRLNKKAAVLIKSIEREGVVREAPSDIVLAAKWSRLPFDDERKKIEREMTQLVKNLPVASWSEGVRGFGAMSLACIIGEAGDIGGYAGPAKLWKRMGLAVMGEVRQGGLPKGSPAEAWVEHGYSSRRRSTMWVIGDCLVKSNRDGEYRTLYLERKAYELQRDPEMKPIKAHRRAQRYMEKRLLRNLWRAWREAVGVSTPFDPVPLAESFTDRRPGDRADGREADGIVPPRIVLPPADPFDRAFARMQYDAG